MAYLEGTRMPYVLTYTILIGISRRETLTAHAAMDELLAIKLAGGSNIAVRDPSGLLLTTEALADQSRAEGTQPWRPR